MLTPDELEPWQACRDPVLARRFLRRAPADTMQARAAPRTPAAGQGGPVNLLLF